jgi:microcystin-dependent protein
VAQPYVGEIRIFAGTFAPVGWQMCDGSLLAISENDTLFNLIGTTYGGDGQSTFGVPDMRGRLPVHFGTGGGASYQIGEMGGVENVTLTINQIPSHPHSLMASTAGALGAIPTNNVLAQPTGAGVQIFFPAAGTQPLNNITVLPIGGSQPHDNMQPYLCVNFIISLYGIYPSQT